MKKYGLFGFLNMLVWLLTALGAVHLGLMGMGYNIFSHSLFTTTLKSWVVPIHYVIGSAGLYSLILYFMDLAGLHDSCSS